MPLTEILGLKRIRNTWANLDEIAGFLFVLVRDTKRLSISVKT